jgi:hypothetical protein
MMGVVELHADAIKVLYSNHTNTKSLYPAETSISEDIFGTSELKIVAADKPAFIQSLKMFKVLSPLPISPLSALIPSPSSPSPHPLQLYF